MGKSGVYERWYLAVFSIFLACLSAILAFETPFGILEKMVAGDQVYVPLNGLGLVPSLQNYWVVIHPPIIFLGFGSLTVMFAYAVSAMLTGDLKTWVTLVRPWTLVSMSVLGLGLVLGGLWAYETQGWGGFWAWDPVENVSFVPWLMVVSFIHGLMIQVNRKRWYGTNIVLGGSPFLLFVYGTFLTRSGYLDKFSVHSFAQMNRTALWVLLGFLSLAVIGFFTLWATKGLRLSRAIPVLSTDEKSPKEIAFTGGTLLLSLLSLSIAVGMSVPFVFGLLGKDAKVVDEPLYHNVVVWFFIPIMALIAFAPFLSWRGMKWKEFLPKFWYILGTAVLIESLLIYVLHSSDWSQGANTAAIIQFPLGLSMLRLPWVLTLTFLTAIAIVGNAWRVGELFKKSKLGIGGFLAHMGVAITLAGLILSRGLEQKEQVLVMEGTSGEGLGYTIRYDRMTSSPKTDDENKAIFTVTSRGSQSTFEARSSYFFTPGNNGADEVFTSPSIQHSWSHDLYLALETPQTDLWDEPQRFVLGETKEGAGVSITYLGLAQHGRQGQAGAWFGARLKVVEDGRTFYGEPKVFIKGQSDTPKVSPSLKATVTGMDASDGSIMLQMPYTHILFPILLFYKPMTILVWIGIAVMTIGGLIAATYRWRSNPSHA